MRNPYANHLALMQGADADVLDLQESGKNVVEDSGAAHTLGERVGCHSIRSHGVGVVPLRYRLATTTPTGTATATVDFHPSERIHPADHLTLVELPKAVRPIHASEPGIVRRDLDITHLIADDRLPR